MCYRKNWRGKLFNNEYYYISDNNYEIYERTLKLDEMPIWYNNIRNNLYRNGNSKLDIIYENNKKNIDSSIRSLEDIFWNFNRSLNWPEIKDNMIKIRFTNEHISR